MFLKEKTAPCPGEQIMEGVSKKVHPSAEDITMTWVCLPRSGGICKSSRERRFELFFR